MAFIQIIEFTTSRIDDVRAVGEEWEAATKGRRTASRRTITADRDRPGAYVMMIEFPSYEAAMENSALPETNKISEQMQKLTDGPPTFRNLDVVDARDLK
jgi:quinol monooxygenase YgiN